MDAWDRVKSLKKQIHKAKEQGRDKEIPGLMKKLEKNLHKIDPKAIAEVIL